MTSAAGALFVGWTGFLTAATAFSQGLPMPMPDIVIVDHDEVPPPGDADIILSPDDKEAQFKKSASGSISDYRCASDSLDPETSRARLMWAGMNRIIPPTLVMKWLYSVENGKVVMNARPYYPMFGTWDGNPNHTKVWKPEDYGMPSKVPHGNVWVAVCRSSCYTPEQQILTDKGYMPIGTAEAEQHAHIITLADQSGMGALRYQKSAVLKYTISFMDEYHVILDFHTRSGGSIRVTPNHTLVNQDGRVVEASTLKVGDSLVSTAGNLDPIESIDVTSHFGKVYNVRPTDETQLSNVVVAQGFLSGSDRYQNEYFDLIQDQVLSQQVDEALIP